MRQKGFNVRKCVRMCFDAAVLDLNEAVRLQKSASGDFTKVKVLQNKNLEKGKHSDLSQVTYFNELEYILISYPHNIEYFM